MFYETVDIAEQYMAIAENMNEKLNQLGFLKKVDYVYNPTEYANASYKCYIQKYCNTPKKILFLGMNPGPWGMSQTGIPFGEVSTVKDWLQINEPVLKPKREHPDRPVTGFDCKKSEVSGKRFWTLMKELCVIPEKFFTNCFVYNYLPLQFLNGKGQNLPPTKLTKVEQQQITEICDDALLKVIKLYGVEIVVGIGRFAEERAIVALEENNTIKVVYLLHPSPQSKAANNWHQDAHRQLKELGILNYFI